VYRTPPPFRKKLTSRNTQLVRRLELDMGRRLELDTGRRLGLDMGTGWGLGMAVDLGSKDRKATHFI